MLTREGHLSNSATNEMKDIPTYKRDIEIVAENAVERYERFLGLSFVQNSFSNVENWSEIEEELWYIYSQFFIEILMMELNNLRLLSTLKLKFDHYVDFTILYCLMKSHITLKTVLIYIAYELRVFFSEKTLASRDTSKDSCFSDEFFNKDGNGVELQKALKLLGNEVCYALQQTPKKYLDKAYEYSKESPVGR